MIENKKMDDIGLITELIIIINFSESNIYNTLQTACAMNIDNRIDHDYTMLIVQSKSLNIHIRSSRVILIIFSRGSKNIKNGLWSEQYHRNRYN